MSEFPRSSLTPTAFLIATEIDADDAVDPRLLELVLCSSHEEGPDLVTLRNPVREEQSVSFNLGQWPAICQAMEALIESASLRSGRPVDVAGS